MNNNSASFLLIGESDVGKTHYGAQILRRLNTGNGSMELIDSDNIDPFVDVMDQISQGLSGSHTPRNQSTTSRWTVKRKSDDKLFDLHWPDYGGEQISAIVNDRRMPTAWRERLQTASAWAFMIRPNRVRLPEDIFSRSAGLPASDEKDQHNLSAQSRLVETLQMLKFKNAAYSGNWRQQPPLCVILSCYDELNTDLGPEQYSRENLPLFYAYLSANWDRENYKVFGVSPLGQALSDTNPDEEFVKKGPDRMGYVLDEMGDKSSDLLAPIDWMLNTDLNQ